MIDGGLTDNGIGDDGAMELAQSLQHNTTLTALYLNGLPPKHVPLVSFQSCFSWIVFVQATTSLMMASIRYQACATRTHWPCFLFNDWHSPSVGSTALCFVLFIHCLLDDHKRWQHHSNHPFPFHSSLSLPNNTALAKHDASSGSSSQ